MVEYGKMICSVSCTLLLVGTTKLRRAKNLHEMSNTLVIFFLFKRSIYLSFWYMCALIASGIHHTFLYQIVVG